MKKIFISVGEISGDNYASQLIKKLPEFSWIGITGPKMEEAGCKSIENIQNISVVGITEAIPKYFHIKKTFNRAVEELDKGVDLVVVVDFPGFNLKLLEEAKKRNIKTVYFIPPQVWAWGKGRIPKIVKNTDILISIWPFEKDLYKEYIGETFSVEYVGHPLLDIINIKETQESFREKLDIDRKKLLIGFLPGSRESEVKVLLPLMLEAGRRIHHKYDLQFLIPVTQNVKNIAEDILSRYKGIPAKLITNNIFENPSYEVMKHSYFSVIASGTATLEAAIIGNPFILTYKVSPMTFFIGKLLVSINFLGLPNIIAGREVVKELLQKECSPENISSWIERYITDKDLYNKTKDELKGVREKLGGKGALDKTAKIIKNLLFQV
jgi:lipid-A-disaccharide synthase